MRTIDKNAASVQREYKSEIERVTAERDKAVGDINIIGETEIPCNVCKHRVGAVGCPIRYTACEFEWRGLEESE